MSLRSQISAAVLSAAAVSAAVWTYVHHNTNTTSAQKANDTLEKFHGVLQSQDNSSQFPDLVEEILAESRGDITRQDYALLTQADQFDAYASKLAVVDPKRAQDLTIKITELRGLLQEIKNCSFSERKKLLNTDIYHTLIDITWVLDVSSMKQFAQLFNSKSWPKGEDEWRIELNAWRFAVKTRHLPNEKELLALIDDKWESRFDEETPEKQEIDAKFNLLTQQVGLTHASVTEAITMK